MNNNFKPGYIFQFCFNCKLNLEFPSKKIYLENAPE